MTSTRGRRALIGCGAAGSIGFLILFHLDAATREGFVLLRHGPSLLMLGPGGWVQIVNFMVCGALMIACSAGLRAAGAGRWGPRLMAVYGGAMIGTAAFVTDPQLGFPPGTPSDRLPGTNAPETWHATLHTVAVMVLYAAATAACAVFARRFRAQEGGRLWAAGLVVNAVAAPVVLVVGAFYLQTESVGSRWFQLADGIAGRIIIPLGWVWAAAVSVRYLRTTPGSERNAPLARTDGRR
ncbi:DUF998 domain-containing protein [Actinoplanes sp. CA-030573]|uniref:DUF998 domain-containing protein n=1 Tax=Actinoplanes sp. CA-030573 TaxID=3239898 RepID=UPI003D90EBC0